MLRRTFLQLMYDVRAELERSSDPAVAVSDFPTIKQKINRVYETLYAKYDWPHLRVMFDMIPLGAGQQFYDTPAELDFDRIEVVVTWQNTEPLPVTRGIEFSDYAIYDSNSDVRSDPVVKWDVRWNEVGSKEVIEVWPLPASSENTLQFQGIRKFERLVDDADQCRLDDQMIILYVAAELVPAKSGKQDILLAAAKERLQMIQRRSKGPSENIRIGLGGTDRVSNRAIIRVAG